MAADSLVRMTHDRNMGKLRNQLQRVERSLSRKENGSNRWHQVKAKADDLRAQMSKMEDDFNQMVERLR